MLKLRNRLTITNRIMLLCGFFFAVTIFLLSAVVFVNLFFSYRSISKNELSETVSKITEYIESGGEVNEETIRQLNTNKWVEVEVYEQPPMYMNRPDKLMMGFKEMERDLKRVSEEAPIFKENPRRDTLERFLNSGYMETSVAQGEKLYLIRAMRMFSREKKILSAFSALFVVFNIFGIIWAFAAGRYIAKRMIKPVSEMTRLATKISIDDINSRIEIEGPDDELRQLGITFNNMLDRLSQSFEEQKRFISDASHELRTPISVIQGYVNLLDRWGKDDPEILSESIESIKTETEHMSRLVKSLLYLASENQKQKTFMAPMSLNECVRNVEKEFTVTALDHSLTVVEKAEIDIIADEDLICQLIWAFLENSIKYCKDGKADITITLYEDKGMAAISIKDKGIGIAKEDLPHVFDRFFRGDKSRSKTIPGTGLGLSIAQEIISRHNGKIFVDSEKDKGCEFIVYLNKK